MNINLVSPKGNGHDYTIRFKEDIVIPEDSKVYLNFATLSRENEVEFFEDQTLTITVNPADVLPRRNPIDMTGPGTQEIGDPLVVFPGDPGTITIPEGRYSYQKLFSKIGASINGLITGSGQLEVDLSHYKGVEPRDLGITSLPNSFGEQVLSLGLIFNPLDDLSGFTAFSQSTTHKKNAGTTITRDGETITCAYVKTSANDVITVGGQQFKRIDSYALSHESYFHFQNDNRQPQATSAGYDAQATVQGTPFRDIKMLKCKSAQTLSTIRTDGGISYIGFYSHEVADGLHGTDGAYPLDDADRTSGGNNPKQFPNDATAGRKKLAMFFGLEVGMFGPSATRVKVRVSIPVAAGITSPSLNAAQRGTPHWDSVNRHITDMRNITGFNKDAILDLGYNDDDFLQFGIQTYYSIKDMDIFESGAGPLNQDQRGTKGRVLHFRVLNLKHNFSPDEPIYSPQNVGGIIFDTGRRAKAVMPSNYANPTGGKLISMGSLCQDMFFCPNPATLNYTNGADADKTRKINSQMPLSVIVAASAQNHGWETIEGPFYVKGANDVKPGIFKYKLNATEELARYINIPTSEDELNDQEQDGSSSTRTELYPNTASPRDDQVLHITNMNLDWRNTSYSIFLKELPIKNYKNNDEQKSGGYAKSILANIPVPFSDAQTYQTGSKSMISATYKPNYQVISNLYNQALATNRLSVEIRKLTNDRPATEIEKSIINLTIMPPDDYKGNINSIDLLTKNQ
jgi:hypothetical protein